jgi:hypothetical protein
MYSVIAPWLTPKQEDDSHFVGMPAGLFNNHLPGADQARLSLQLIAISQKRELDI